MILCETERHLFANKGDTFVVMLYEHGGELLPRPEARGVSTDTALRDLVAGGHVQAQGTTSDPRML